DVLDTLLDTLRGDEDLADVGRYPIVAVALVEAAHHAADRGAEQIRGRVRARGAAGVHEKPRCHLDACAVCRRKGKPYSSFAFGVVEEGMAVKHRHPAALAPRSRLAEQPARIEGVIEHAGHRVRSSSMKAADAASIPGDDQGAYFIGCKKPALREGR